MASRSRAVFRVPTCPANAPFRWVHPLANPSLYECRDRKCLGAVGDGRGGCTQVEVRVVDTIERA